MESLSLADIGEYTCSECDYKATWESSIVNHLKSVHKVKKFQCPECDYETIYKSNLVTHLKDRNCSVQSVIIK